MHFCAECGQVLDPASSIGVDPCPRCGSANASATASPPSIPVTTKVFAPSIESLINWSGIWLAITRERLGVAHAARSHYAHDASGALTAEFHAGLAAIVAAAFAVEAEQQRVLGPKPTPASPPPTRPWNRNWGDYLGQLLVERNLIDQATSEELGRLVDLRHRCVHPVAVSEPLALHPVGTNTSRELVTYNADEASALIGVAERVVLAVASMS